MVVLYDKEENDHVVKFQKNICMYNQQKVQIRQRKGRELIQNVGIPVLA